MLIGDRHRRARLSQVLELLETVVLLTGYDNPVSDVHHMKWLARAQLAIVSAER
jgi:hypothetical protein